MGSKNFDTPPEVEVIKSFVRRTLSSDVSVSIQTHRIIISTPSASLAGSLRPHLHRLKQELGTEKRVLIQIA